MLMKLRFCPRAQKIILKPLEVHRFDFDRQNLDAFFLAGRISLESQDFRTESRDMGSWRKPTGLLMWSVQPDVVLPKFCP